MLLGPIGAWFLCEPVILPEKFLVDRLRYFYLDPLTDPPFTFPGLPANLMEVVVVTPAKRNTPLIPGLL